MSKKTPEERHRRRFMVGFPANCKEVNEVLAIAQENQRTLVMEIRLALHRYIEWYRSRK